MVSGKYGSAPQGENLASMPLFDKYKRKIPLRELLRTINATAASSMFAAFSACKGGTLTDTMAYCPSPKHEPITRP
jgi:hypothetical protein